MLVCSCCAKGSEGKITDSFAESSGAGFVILNIILPTGHNQNTYAIRQKKSDWETKGAVVHQKVGKHGWCGCKGAHPLKKYTARGGCRLHSSNEPLIFPFFFEQFQRLVTSCRFGGRSWQKKNTIGELQSILSFLWFCVRDWESISQCESQWERQPEVWT